MAYINHISGVGASVAIESDDMKFEKKQRVQEREDRTIQDTTYVVLGMMFLAVAIMTQFFG